MFGKKSYLIRCFHEKLKIFECPIDEKPEFMDVFGTCIAYTTKDQTKFHAIDIGGYYDSLEKIIGNEESYADLIPVNQFRIFPHTFFQDYEEENELVSFKIAHNSLKEPNFKAVFVTRSQCSIYPFTFEEDDQTKWRIELTKHRKILKEDEIDFQNEECLYLLRDTKDENFITDTSFDRNDIFTVAEEDDFMGDHLYSNSTMDQFEWLDFDLVHENIESYDQATYEIALLQDKITNNLVILKGVRYCLEFEFKGYLELKGR
mmetsp:Transcript_29189/g.28248  ORF Transcript_29189/g.28248 Transcript_29189/m.28248 type:complete len:261 (+) Transcript_29189:171-953(+)